MTIADRILARRTSLGLTQDELAKMVGWGGKASICKIEASGDNITLKTIDRLVNALETTRAHLLGLDDEMSREDRVGVEDLDVEFRKRLDIALETANMKPSLLSRVTGISEATISQYRSGYSRPKSQRLIVIARALGVSPAWLIGITNSSEKEYRIEGVRSTDELVLVQLFREMNDTGRQEALKRIKELIQIPYYRT